MTTYKPPPLTNGRTDKTNEAPINVLCVDDEASFLASTKQLLELDSSFHVDIASSVDDALEKMKSKVFDVVVSDYQMPEKSGLDFLKEVRDGGNDIPFILFTGRGREEVAVKALNLGADRYFNKFGNPETVYGQLVYGIRQSVAQRRAEKEIWDREERLRAVFASSPDGLFTSDLNGIITDCNLETLKLVEASSMSDIVGKHFQAFVAKEENEKVNAVFSEVLEKGFVTSRETKVLTKSGAEVPIGFSASILRDAYGKPVGAVALVRNISDRKKAEATLQQSESKFRGFFENSPDYCYIISPEGKIVDVSKTVLASLGYSKDELLGKPLLSTIYAQSSRQKARSLFEKWKKTGKIQNEELEIVTKQGERRAVLLNAHSVHDIDGRLLYFVSVQKDVTAHKKADEALRKSEEKYRSIVELSPDGIATMNLKGTVTSVNKAFLDLTGFSKDEIVGKHFTKLGTLRLQDIPKYTKLVYSMLRGKNPEPFEFDYLRKDGTQRLGEARISMMEENGKKIGLQAILADITERKQMEQELKDSEEKYRRMVEQAPDSIMTFDLNGVVTSCNATAVAMTGRSKEEMIGKHFSELGTLTEAQIQKITKLIPSVLEGAILDPFEVAGRNEDGSSAFGEVHISLMKEGEKVVAFQTITRDVTERKMAEMALREGERRFRELSELLPEVIFETDEKGFLTFVNHEAYTQFGYSHEEFESGLHAHQMLVPEDRGRAREALGRVMNGEKPGPNEYTALRKDGTTFPIIVNSTPIIRGDRVAGIRGVMVDITERKMAEMALREGERRFRELSELLPEVIFEIDLTGVISFVNRCAFDLFGFSEQDLGKGLNLIEMLTPESQEKAKESLDKLLSGEDTGSSEYTIVRKDGTTFSCIAHCSLIVKENEPVGIRGIIVDITERKKAEDELKDTLKKMETLNEKLNVVGRLTRHDARNKLSAIVNNIYLAKMKMATRPDALEHLRDIELAVYQMEKMFDFARNYEMLGTEELSYVDVKKSFDEAFLFLSCPDNIKPVTECEGLKVRADSLLRQIFYNLIDNSVKYGEKVSQIRIYCIEKEDNLKLVYEDDGVGIPAGEKEKIFLEGYGKGTGYGLYLIRKICENYGWVIKETGVPNKGAQFTMTIPKTNKTGEMSYILD